MIIQQRVLRRLPGRIASILIPLALLCAAMIAVNISDPAAAAAPAPVTAAGYAPASGPAPQAVVSVYAGGLGPVTAEEVGILPTAVAVRGSQVYVADSFHNVVRLIDTETGSETVVAGNGFAGFSGDGGPAAAAELYIPRGLALDAAGNLYIADYFNHRIRRVDTRGIITTVAGNGAFGYDGDGGPATSARLYTPEDVAVDADGNLYIADVSNHRIRRVDTNGMITTVAGDGNQSDGGNGGPATSASLNNPTGVAVDAAGNVYITDFYNSCVRKVDSNGMITNVAGKGGYGYDGDGGLATAAHFNGPARRDFRQRRQPLRR